MLTDLLKSGAVGTIEINAQKKIRKAINERWLAKWKSKGYAKVKNPDLWMRLEPLLNMHNVTFYWIKGHAGHPENERCDALAVAAGAGAVAAGKILPEDAGYLQQTLVCGC